MRKRREEPPERRLLKTSNAKKAVFPQKSNLQPLDYRSTAPPLELETSSDTVDTVASSRAQVVEQRTGNPKAAGSISVGRQFFRIACFKWSPFW